MVPRPAPRRSATQRARAQRATRARPVNRDVPAHWIKPNHVTRIPRRHVVLDCEAVEDDHGSSRTQTFRLAVASFDHQDKKGRGWQPTELGRFTDAPALWQWITDRTRNGKRTVVVAHNLAYDLRVSSAFRILPELGWSLEMVRLDGGSAWCSWRRGDAGLQCVDSVSWFGVGLDRVAQLVRMTKPALPGPSSSIEEWFARCEADVAILREAWLRVLAWIEAGDLGNFKPTGAGQGWAYLRHRHLTHPILHHGAAPVARVERAAAYAGRCEAWRWGRLGAGPWAEWDFAAAYAQVCEEAELPTRLGGHLGPRGAQRALDGADSGAGLLRCRITTESPTTPHRGSRGICWPVGSWEGWLWDIEARQAVEAGGHVEAVEGWHYDTAPALRQWASSVLDLLDADAATFDPLLRLVVKGWSRTTVGRFGAQWAGWDDIGEAHGSDVALWQSRRTDTGDPYRLMMVGGRCLAEGERGDAPDSAVHVMSWVMAACRVRLWRAMQVAGFDSIAYVDTDGLLVDPHGSERLAAAELPGLRMKSKWRTAEILGPRQLVLDGRLRAAGIPSSAVRTGPRTWEAEVWRSLPASLRRGELDSVTITDRRFALRGTDHRRAHVAGGRTVALRV